MMKVTKQQFLRYLNQQKKAAVFRVPEDDKKSLCFYDPDTSICIAKTFIYPMNYPDDKREFYVEVI